MSPYIIRYIIFEGRLEVAGNKKAVKTTITVITKFFKAIFKIPFNKNRWFQHTLQYPDEGIFEKKLIYEC